MPRTWRRVTWAVYQRGLKVSGVEYVEAIAAVHAAGRKLAAFLADWDVLLTTTLPAPPPKLGYFDQNGDVQTFVDRVTEYLSITPLHNATGTPAMSVPLHWTADGLAGRRALRRPLRRRGDAASPRRRARDGAALVQSPAGLVIRPSHRALMTPI